MTSSIFSEYIEKIPDSDEIHHIEKFKTSKFKSDYLIKRLPENTFELEIILTRIFTDCLLEAIDINSTKFSATEDNHDFRAGFTISGDLLNKTLLTPMSSSPNEKGIEIVVDRFLSAVRHKLGNVFGTKGTMITVEVTVLDLSILPRK